MDIISFNESATANGRIEKFIENPDSNSGIVTVPKTIASSETITIPDGRVAVLPNVQVDGTLNVEGEVFIPSGATFGDLENQIALKADTSYVNGKYSGFKNYIINGSFDVWQRGTSQTSSGYGSADRWINSNEGSTKTVSIQITNKTEPFNSIKYIRTVVSSVAGANNVVTLQQRVEGVNTLAGKTATLSFWAKADSNKNIAVDFAQYFGSGGTPSAIIEGISATKFAITSSWTKYTLTVDIPSIAGKSAGTNNNDSLFVRFWFDAGSDYNSRTANLGQQSGTFDIAQVQLEEGSVATPFEQRPYGLELSLCQRYYETLRIGLTNGEVSAAGKICGVVFNFKTIKRSTPSIALITDLSSTSFPAGVASISSDNISLLAYKVSTSGNTNANWYQLISASAEL